MSNNTKNITHIVDRVWTGDSSLPQFAARCGAPLDDYLPRECRCFLGDKLCTECNELFEDEMESMVDSSLPQFAARCGAPLQINLVVSKRHRLHELGDSFDLIRNW